MNKALVCLSVLLSLVACHSQQELVGSLTEREANEVVVVLDSQRIQATKISVEAKAGNKAPTFSVQVDSKQASEALRILVDNRLPKSPSAGLGQVYPSDSGGLIPSQSEEKAKFLRATQGEVENMLMVLPGIVEVRVVVVIPDPNIVRDLHAPAPQATASVAIVFNPIDAKGTPPAKAEEIKYLVSSAIEGLAPNRVSVVMSENVPSTAMGFPKLVRKPVAVQNGYFTDSRLRDDLLLWLFGFLALSGVALGVFGLIRNRSLRDQLSKALNAHTES
ncbi:MAG: hypothetical protein I8H75_04180 [Myxococcaceae bacterium]|nr:hypothetical protein [Myxococcaceae bacterium]